MEPAFGGKLIGNRDNMKTIEQLKVFDIVWIKDEANGRHREPQAVTVSNIGSKLITLTNGDTYRKDTLCKNDAYGFWKIILNLDDYKILGYKKELAGSIVSKMHYFKDIPIEDLKAIAQLLKIDV